jgi:hypothetical protein
MSTLHRAHMQAEGGSQKKDTVDPKKKAKAAEPVDTLTYGGVHSFLRLGKKKHVLLFGKVTQTQLQPQPHTEPPTCLLPLFPSPPSSRADLLPEQGGAGADSPELVQQAGEGAGGQGDGREKGE